MRNTRRIAIVWIAICLALGTGGIVHARQTQEGRYFAQTGHWVTGPFWSYYRNFASPELVFGHPITEAFQDAHTGAQVQYFQRARLEYHPEFPAAPVLPTQLGRLLYRPGAPALDLVDLFACRAFAETGFSVCYAFLDFFDRYGGVAAFGYPISGFESYNGRIVQYFERARFEWYPELAEGQKVALGDLGRVYFDNLPEDARLLAPVTGDALIGNVLSLRTHAFTWKAVTQGSDRQLVFVVLQDQTLRPVAGANGTLTASFPLGEPVSMSFTTDNSGVAILELPFQNQPAGSRIFISVSASYLGLSGSAQTSFRVWQ